MKTKLVFVALAWLALLTFNPVESTAFAQGTAFTYQGRLDSAGLPASGSYDFQFRLYDASTGGNQIPAVPVSSDVGVTNGLFTTGIDFGNDVFSGTSYWLEIGVQTNGGNAFTTLSPRQLITPAPYAIYSASAASASSVSGPISMAQLPTGILTNGVTNAVITGSVSGTFFGNGAGINNLDIGLNTGGAISPSGFVVASKLTSDFGPHGLVAVDVNNDNKMDLVCANFASGIGHTLDVFTNDGSGGFRLCTTLEVGFAPRSVVALDINKDGSMDLVCDNFSVNSSTTGTGHFLKVFFGDGSGNFSFVSVPAVALGPRSLVTADFNGDGYMDLACVNSGANTVSVLYNDEAGSFNSAIGFPVGVNPAGLAVADVNGDNQMDLICANLGSGVGNTLTILTNNDGFFTTSSTLVVGTGPISVTAADVNGDNKPDLISVNEFAGSLSVLTNDGSGGFVLSTTLPTGTLPWAVAAEDFDGDGKRDLACAVQGNSTVTIFHNTGAGHFVQAGFVTVGTQPRAVVAADLNGDGRLDLVSSDTFTNTLTVLFNTPSLFNGSFGGNGGSLTNLSASSLNGTLSDAVLSSNVALLNGNQTFIGQNAFNNPANNFSGSGAGLTGLNAANITSGILPDARLSTNVLLSTRTNSLALGTTAAPVATLEIQGGADSDGSNDPHAMAFDWRNGGFRHWIRTRHSASGSSNAMDFYLNASANPAASSSPGVGNNLTLTLEDGRVGIGTSHPTNALQVVGTVKATAFQGDGSGLTGVAVLSKVNIFTDQIRLDTTNGFSQSSAGNFYIDAPFIGGGRFTVLTNGNVGIGTNSPSQKLHVVGGALFTSGSAGANQSVSWTPGSASWSFTSDRNAKERFAPIDRRGVLEKVCGLPIAEWSYIGYDQRHIGPMAQDFHAAFPLNPSDTSLNDADLHGVALAAIQGLNEKVDVGSRKSEDRIQKLEAENAELKERNETLEKRLGALEKIVFKQKSTKRD